MIFVGLFGYYVIPNAIRRDIISRCGMVAASTPMRSIEYLVGKFLGNLAFLTTFLGGFLLSSMAMLFVRGEASLEPLVFVCQYLLLTPAAIILVSAVAVFFESIPLLAGKLGDIAYFFLFMIFISLVVGNEVSGGRINWTRCFDFTGFGFMIHQLQHTLHTDSVAIGSSSFDPTKPTIVFPGLSMTRDWIVPRIISMLLPLLLLPAAALVFHRFDPVRTGRTAGRTNRKWLGKLQSLAKPLSRHAVAMLNTPSRGGSFFSAIWTDAVLTLTLSPLVLIALVGVSVATVSVPPQATLLVVFAVLAVVVCDVATRDTRSGTTASLYAVPRLRENFVLWKFASTSVLAFLFCVVPLAVAAVRGGTQLRALVVGILFVSAAATLLGVVTKNAKAFIVLFLSFWYVVVNDKGASPLLDFAGFYGHANARAPGMYAALSVVALVGAHLAHRARLAR